MIQRHASMAFVLVSITAAGVARGQETGTLPDRVEVRQARIAAIDPATATDASRSAPDVATPAKPWLKGYQVEMGVASSSIARGRPVYLSRYDPSSQATGAVSIDRLGPGTLTLSAWNATAISRFEEQPGTAVQVDLSAAYTFRLGESTEVGIGYLVSIFPKVEDGDSMDQAHEILASLAYESKWVTPKLSIAADPIRQKGFYASLAGSRAFELGPVTLSPQISLGVAAYSEVPLQVNDATASLSAQWGFGGPGYVALRGAVSYLCGPSDSMPDDQRTALGRTVPWAMIAVGAQR